jgi:type IV pilus assembly protein PilP
MIPAPIRLTYLAQCALGAAVILLASGCARSDMDDLEAYVKSVKERKNIVPKPLPDFPPEEIYLYPHTYGAMRDPFTPLEETKKTDVENIEIKTTRPECVRPDPYRKTETLEKYPLDALKMVGTLSENNEIWGLVQDPEGLIHQVQTNHYLGQNNGKIIYIGESKIELKEVADDGTGCYQERDASLAVSVP